jgi:hypothetical protein
MTRLMQAGDGGAAVADGAVVRQTRTPKRLPKQLETLEAAIVRIGKGEGTRDDYDLVITSNLRGADLDAEIKRLRRVDQLRTIAGSPAKLQALESQAAEIEASASVELEKLRAELDQVTQRITAQVSSINRTVSEAKQAVKVMEGANQALRNMVPLNVRQFVTAMSKAATEKFGPGMKAARQKVAAMQWMVNQEVPDDSPEAPDHIPLTMYDECRIHRNVLGITATNAVEFRSMLPAIQARCRRELPEAIAEAERIEAEFKAAKDEAKLELDVYLPPA